MSKAIRKLYQQAGQKAPDGKGIHTLRAHKCVVNYLKKGFSKDEAWKRCMGAMKGKAIRTGHHRTTSP